MIESVLRIAASLVITTFTGFFYYNPNFNPLAKIWLQCQTSVKHSDGMMRELTGTLAAKMLITIFLLHFTEERAFMLLDLVYLAAKLTFMTEALQFIHYMWKQGSLRELALNTVYDFLILLGILFAVTFHRY
uniref:Uncharacterized protein n=1 Tax=Plectus sambesii TaxID=2011161 RepID=A0A914XR25_9BILA